MKVTIKDIAEYVGVSAMTVSNVINKKSGKVSEKTVKKIEKAIVELGYVPDYSARSLVSKRSKMIGVIIPQTESHKQFLLENPFYSEIVSGIENKLREKGYYMMLTGVDKDKSYLDVLVNWNLDAAIVLGIYKEGFYELLKKVNIPILLMDSYIDDSYFYNLRIDDFKGGYLATQYLIKKGHRNIAVISGHIKKEGVAEKRFLGYQKALEEAGISYSPDWLYSDSVSYDYGMEAGRQIALNHSDITAVFATADLIAAGAMASFHELGVSVPEQMSLIGFDNLSISKMIYPKLTTVNQNIFEKGEKGVEILINALDHKEIETGKDTVLDINIIERQSVKNLK